MEFSVKEFLISYQSQLQDVLHKVRLVPSCCNDSTQLQIQKVEEIGDGNLNFVYRVQLALGEDSVSVIVKHAPNYIKVSSIQASSNCPKSVAMCVYLSV